MRFSIAVSSLVRFGLTAGCGGGARADVSQLENTLWVLTSGADITPSDGIVPVIYFLENGTASGWSGCNRFTTQHTIDGGSLSFAETTGTRMACPPRADEIESAYLAALGAVASWEIDSEQLVLSDAHGNELLRFGVGSTVDEL